jgi:hypothetical protein
MESDKLNPISQVRRHARPFVSQLIWATSWGKGWTSSKSKIRRPSKNKLQQPSSTSEKMENAYACLGALVLTLI